MNVGMSTAARMTMTTMTMTSSGVVKPLFHFLRMFPAPKLFFRRFYHKMARAVKHMTHVRAIARVKKTSVSQKPARRGMPRRAGDKICLLGSVQPVARIAETRQDIAVLVEVAVTGGDEHIHVGVFPGEASDALRRGDDRHELDLFNAVAL